MTETVFDLWATWKAVPSPQPDQPFFFGLDDPAAQEFSLFEVDLPARPWSAAEQLEAAQTALDQAGRALGAVPGRLDRLVGQALAGNLGPASFALGGTDGLGPAEAELLASLGGLPGGPPVESYGLAERLPDWKQSQKEFLEAFERLQKLLTHLAWVETRVDGALLARTVVDWSGDLDTVWGKRLDAAQFELHRRALQVALSSRVALLRLLTTVLQATAKISILLSTPGAQLLALPAAWRYVNQILREFETYRAITAPVGG